MMKTEVVHITPKIARQMLDGNEGNRPLRRAIVDNLKQAFERGEYVMSHQGIAFNGRHLLDGQHRLVAISEMPESFSVEMLVCRGVTDAAAKVMDIGYKRTLSDILMEDRKLVETARFLAYVYLGKSSAVTPTYLLPFVEKIRAPHAELLDFCCTNARMWSSAPVRAAAMMVWMASGDTDYVKLVYRSLVTADFTTMPRSAQALFRSHVIGRVRASASSDAFVRCLRVFNPANADITKIQVKDTAPALESVRALLRREIFGAIAPAPPAARRERSPAQPRSYALAGI